MTKKTFIILVACLIFLTLISNVLKLGHFPSDKSGKKYPKINLCPNFDPGHSKYINTKIAIVTVIEKEEEFADNEIAINTTKCYAEHYGYQMHVIYVEKNVEIQENCKQNDIFFQRHCVLAWFLEKKKEAIDYALHIDADMGVVNPCHTIQEYIDEDEKIEIIFYERYFNHEIAAGSYLIKNTQTARNFLTKLSSFVFPENGKGKGNDKGALLQLLMELHFADNNSKMQCYELYKKINTNGDLFEFEVCAKNALLSNSSTLLNDTIKIIRKMVPGWVRDGWLTETKWSSQDFIFHGWKISKLTWEWNFPFTKKFNMNQCKFNDFSFPNFKHKNNVTSTKEIQKLLQLKTAKVHKSYVEILHKLNVKNHKI